MSSEQPIIRAVVAYGASIVVLLALYNAPAAALRQEDTLTLRHLRTLRLPDVGQARLIAPRITEMPGTANGFILVTSPTAGRVFYYDSARDRPRELTSLGNDSRLSYLASSGRTGRLFLADLAKQSVHIIRADGRIISTVEDIGTVYDLATIGDSVVVNSFSPAPAMFGLAFHWLDSSGSIARSLAATTGPILRSEAQTRWSIVADSIEGVFAISAESLEILHLASTPSQAPLTPLNAVPVGRIQRPDGLTMLVDAFHRGSGRLLVLWNAFSSLDPASSESELDSRFAARGTAFMSLHQLPSGNTVTLEMIQGYALGFTTDGRVYGYGSNRSVGTLGVWEVVLR